MNKRIVSAISVVAVFTGLGLATLGATPDQTKYSALDKHDNSALTISASPESNPSPAMGTPTSPTSPLSSPTTTATTPKTSTVAAPQDTATAPTTPVAVTVQSATKRTEEVGLHKDYYCDLVYSDGSSDVKKVGESNDSVDQTGRFVINLNVTCDQLIGQSKS